MEERILQPKAQPSEPVAAAPFPDDAPGLSSGDETDVESDGEGEFEFEFPSLSRGSPALADELFADGRIRPFYPVFGRAGGVHGYAGGTAQPAPAAAPRVRGQLGRLFLEESRARDSSTCSTTSTASSSSSDGGALDGAAPESYCLWTPAGPGSGSSASSPRRPPRKSSSTGSMARWRRISELVVGRSHSDGKEKFLFLHTPPHEAPNKGNPRPKPSAAPAGGRKGSATPAAEVDTVTAAHRIAYIATGAGGGTPRRTFLPYREELVGFFANVNGISRSHHHPF